MARQARRNRQKMFYATFVGSEAIYKTDDDGNKVYVKVKDDDGTVKQIPVKVGETEPHYSTPVKFYANISGKLNDAIIRAFGADESDNHAQISAPKGVLNFKVGTRIWLHSEVKYKDSTSYTADGDSADYEVRGVLKEGLLDDLFYLTVLNHESESESESDTDED